MLDSSLSGSAEKPAGAKSSAKTKVRKYKEDLIVNAAATLFYERGFQRTTLDDIATSLGVTKPFIYRYFKSKDNILERLFDIVCDDLFNEALKFQSSEKQDPAENFRVFVRAYIMKNLRFRNFSAILLEEEKNLSKEKQEDMRRRQSDFDKLLTGLIRAGVEAGVFRVDDPAVTSLAISGMVRWTHRWYSPSGRLSEDEMGDRLTDIALKMVGWVGRASTNEPDVR